MKKARTVIFCGLIGLLVGCESLVYVREDSDVKHVYKMKYNGSSQIQFSPVTGTTYETIRTFLLMELKSLIPTGRMCS